MKAWQILEHGDVKTLKLSECPIPEPKEGQLLIQQKGIGINYIDIYQRSGIYSVPHFPWVLGKEGLGKVVKVGGKNSSFAENDVVAYANSITGNYAEYCLVSEEACISLPENLDQKIFLASLLQGLTAHYLAFSTHPVQAEDWVCITAAAGGVGHILTQICQQKRARVIGVVSSEEKKDWLSQFQPWEVIVSKNGTYADQVKKITHGKGVRVVYDSIGQATFQESLLCLEPRGLMVSYGNSSGAVANFDLGLLNRMGSLFLTRPNLNHYLANRQELTQRADFLIENLKNKKLNIHIGQEFSFSDLPKAHFALENRSTKGKIVVWF